MRDHWQPAVNRLRSALTVETGPVDRGYGNGAGLRSPHVSIRAQTAPTVVHLTPILSPPIGAQRLRGPGAVLRELVGNSVPLPGNPSERDPEGCQNSDPGLKVGFDTLQGSGQSSWG